MIDVRKNTLFWLIFERKQILLLPHDHHQLFWILTFHLHLKGDMPILTCIFFTFNWLTLTSEMHFVKFHPEVASCLLWSGKRKYAPLGMRLLWKYIRNIFSGIPFNFTHFVISQKLQRILSWNFGFTIRKIWAFIWYQKNILLSVEPWGMRMWSA